LRKLRNGDDKLRGRERLGQKNAIRNAFRGPLLGRRAGYVNDREGRVDLSSVLRNFPTVDPADEIDVGHKRAILALAALQ
jgi:hypothetical protein